MPLFLEIGCGVGFHPLKFSKQNPKHQMIAIEQTTNKFSKFYKRYLNHQCPENLYPFHDNAVHLITGIIEFATNESFYAEECYEWMTNVWELEALEYKTIPHNFPPRTHFEKKYLERGQKCFNLTFKKPS